MNLIEQQQKARALPMQYLQQAANGQSVELAPWIATAELQRRTTADQHMQAAKGPQGPQPTVKDQIEQKAGLMATKAAQIAQATAAQQSSPPPGPIPGGIPAPEPQPEEPVMAARGGLMNAPVSFNFAHGGILGYAGPQGSEVKDPNAEQLASDRQAVMEGLKKFGYAAADIAAMPFRAASALLNTLIVRPTRAVTGAEVPYFPMLGGGDSGSVTPYTDRAYQEKQAAKPAPPAPTASSDASRPKLPGQGITAALPKPPPSAPAPATAPKPRVAQVNQEQEQEPAPAPTPAPTPASAPTPMDSAGIAALKYATEAAPARTQQDAINDLRALRKESGADQPIGVNEAAQQARQDEIQKRREAQAKELAYSAYVQGLVGTPGSAKLAYDRTLATALADEGTYGQAKYKNISDLEAAKRGLTKDYQTGLESTTAADRLAAANAAKDKGQTAANIYGTNRQAETSIYGTDVQAKTSKYNTDEHVKSSMAIAKLQERGANARQGSSDARQAAKELRDQELSIEADIKALTSQRNKLSGSFTPEDRKELANVDEALKNARAQKALIRGGPAAAPEGTMDPNRAKQFKVLR